MYIYSLLGALAFLQAAHAAEDLTERQSSGCPAVWTTIHNQLVIDYVGLTCNDDARAVIRLAFHDCFSGAGCDGSIILANECSRSENSGLADICGKISSMAAQYDVGVADLIQFAAATAIVDCLAGPQLTVKVGRTDSTSAAPDGTLPVPTASADTLVAQFAAKGFSSTDLVALVGAHTSGKQFFVDPSKSGAPFDSTPGIWDVTFYGQVLTGTAPFILESDKNLATDPTTSGDWQNFAVNQIGWNGAFITAMNKMALLGDGGDSLTDCTSVFTNPVQTKARRFLTSARAAARAAIRQARSEQ